MMDNDRNFPVYNRDIEVRGRSSHIRVVLSGDWHYGAAMCDADGLSAGLKHLATAENTYWLGMGDHMDAIGFNDKRMDTRSLDPEVWEAVGRNVGHYHDEVKRRLARMVRPAGHNCLGLLEGNHETTGLQMKNCVSVLRYLVDDYRDWCAERSKPTTPNPWFEPLGDCAAVVLRFSDGSRRSQLVLFVSHGAGMAASIGGRMNKLESVMAWLPDADVYACGHFHDECVRPRPTLKIAYSSDSPRVVAVNKLFVLVPSFARTYGGDPCYASRRLYPPSVMGWRVLDIEPFGDRRRFGGGREFSRPSVSCTVTI